MAVPTLVLTDNWPVTHGCPHSHAAGHPRSSAGCITMTPTRCRLRDLLGDGTLLAMLRDAGVVVTLCLDGSAPPTLVTGLAAAQGSIDAHVRAGGGAPRGPARRHRRRRRRRGRSPAHRRRVAPAHGHDRSDQGRRRSRRRRPLVRRPVTRHPEGARLCAADGGGGRSELLLPDLRLRGVPRGPVGARRRRGRALAKGPRHAHRRAPASGPRSSGKCSGT